VVLPDRICTVGVVVYLRKIDTVFGLKDIEVPLKDEYKGV
jgi:hypothetical protein